MFGVRRTVHGEGYPTTGEVYAYTAGDPGARERAFLDLLTSPFGQAEVVGRHFLPVEPPA